MLSGQLTAPILRDAFAAIRNRYGLTGIEPFEQRGEWWVRAVINPDIVQGTGVAIAAAPPKAVGTPLRWPHLYLRGRAARRTSYAAEARWRPIVFPGSGSATFNVVRRDGTTVQVIPDVFKAAAVGDIRNVQILSLIQQLRDFPLVATPALATSLTRGRGPLTGTRPFSTAARHETHVNGRTGISGPLLAATGDRRPATGDNGGRVNFVTTGHSEKRSFPSPTTPNRGRPDE